MEMAKGTTIVRSVSVVPTSVHTIRVNVKILVSLSIHGLTGRGRAVGWGAAGWPGPARLLRATCSAGDYLHKKSESVPCEVKVR
jgi:hypothetical protein